MKFEGHGFMSCTLTATTGSREDTESKGQYTSETTVYSNARILHVQWHLNSTMYIDEELARKDIVSFSYIFTTEMVASLLLGGTCYVHVLKDNKQHVIFNMHNLPAYSGQHVQTKCKLTRYFTATLTQHMKLPTNPRIEDSNWKQ